MKPTIDTETGAYLVGKARIQKIPEMDLNGMTLLQLMPGLDPLVATKHPAWMTPGTFDAAGHAFLSLHTWMVEVDGKIILVDTGAGNDKSRPQQMVLDHLHNPYLERLAAAGVSPEDVDFVLHTHIHSDHVGWNTRLQDGQWVPTFPNATVICSALEWRYGAALTDGDCGAVAEARATASLGEPIRVPVSGTFEDSMRPLEKTGKVRLVPVNGEEVLPGIRFHPTPGHSIDHASIELISDGEVALFGGDVLHHPLEIYDVNQVSCFCEFPNATRTSRLKLLTRSADTRSTYFSSHFPRSSAGHISRTGNGFRWDFIE